MCVLVGGVAISDKIGNTNATVVSRLCRSDGVLLRPERPATAMDSTFLGTDGPLGEVWHTYVSDAQQRLFVEYVLTTNLTESYRFFWKELFDTEDDDQPQRVISDIYVAFGLQNPLDYHWLTSTNSSPSILLPSCAQNTTTFFSPFRLRSLLNVVQLDVVWRAQQTTTDYKATLRTCSIQYIGRYL